MLETGADDICRKALWNEARGIVRVSGEEMPLRKTGTREDVKGSLGFKKWI